MGVAQMNERLVRRIDEASPMRPAPDYEKAVNFSGSYDQPVHRWFRYREGFSPSMMRLIKPGDRVYDPFCGCGTALIEAARQEVEAVGTDVNPLAVFVASTKSRSYRISDVHEFANLARAARTENHGRAEPPRMPLLPKLFLPAALDELLRMKAVIDSAPNARVHALLRLAWLSILEDCSNVFKEGNGLKYRAKRRAPGKYVDIPAHVWIAAHFGADVREFVRSRWGEATFAIHQDLRSRSSAWRSPRVIEASCLEPALASRVGEVDTAIFSPPYANRFDYFEAFKVELWMGGFVHEPKALAMLRKRSMRNNLTVRERARYRIPELEALLDLMNPASTSVRMGIKETLRGYFEDVRKLADNLRSCLRPGGKSICVVGNSAYAGVLIPTDTLCAMVFRQSGFTVDTVDVARSLTVSPQQRRLMSPELLRRMRESVVICTKE
jgi:site-specific DNA-methyltransferase (adenine-specific)